MIEKKNFTGKMTFAYREENYEDRFTCWTEYLYDGGVEVVVPEQVITNSLGLRSVIPEHTEFVPFTKEEGKNLKYAYDKICKRIRNQLNK